MRIEYYDKDYDKWSPAKIKTAVVEDSGITKSVYGDNLREIPHHPDPYGLKKDEWPWWEVFMGWLMFAGFVLFIACCVKYLLK